MIMHQSPCNINFCNNWGCISESKCMWALLSNHYTKKVKNTMLMKASDPLAQGQEFGIKESAL